MTLKTKAVYSEGALLPATPLPLAEGQTVEVIVSPAPSMADVMESADERIENAKTLQEWIEAANAAPPEDDDYDLFAALDENRKGARPLFPPDMKGISW